MPLGIDLGTKKVRMTYAVATPAGASVEAVTARDREEGVSDEWLAAMLHEMRTDLGARTRACSMALGCHEATIDALALPALSYRERISAAHLEARRRFGDGGNRIVRLFPTNEKERFLLATTDVSNITRRKQLAAKAGLRLSTLTVDCLAWHQLASPELSVIDVGATSTRLHFRDRGAPRAVISPIGGEELTREIARALQIDERSAEHRKRILGAPGVGAGMLAALIAWVREQLGKRETHGATGVMIVGNGSRLPEIRRLFADIVPVRQWAAGCSQLERSRYPDDIRRAAFSDWALSIALASLGANPS